MNLDDLDRFKQLDTLNMLGEIDSLPDQLAFACQLGMKHILPDWTGFKQVLIAGMGGSAAIAVPANIILRNIITFCNLDKKIGRKKRRDFV